MLPIDELSSIVLEEAIGIHKEFGPGLFETVYESVLADRLRRRGLKVERQVQVKVVFDGETYDPAFKICWLMGVLSSRSRQSRDLARRT